jgi:two-component sensor histidine kinase
MSIVTTLIQQIGGTLEVSRDAGTTFVVKFQDKKATTSSP